MATTIHSTTRLQAYQTLIYARSLQPELHYASQTSVLHQDYYAFNIAIMPGSHACTFTSIDGCATELVSDNTVGNSDIALLESMLCSAEKDIEVSIPRTKINYITAAQTEQLSPHIYLETYNELDELARDQAALAHRFNDRAGPCLSMVDIQPLSSEIQFQSYHLIAEEHLVLRTQSIFELVK